MSASISFINFMASMMQTVWPASTISPTRTNGGDFGIRCGVECADDRRLDQVMLFGGLCWRRSGLCVTRSRRLWNLSSAQALPPPAHGNRSRRKRPVRRRTRRRDGLLQPNAQVAMGIFELLKPMLGHEGEQSLQLPEVHPGNGEFRLLPLFFGSLHMVRVRGIPAEHLSGFLCPEE